MVYVCVCVYLPQACILSSLAGTAVEMAQQDDRHKGAGIQS